MKLCHSTPGSVGCIWFVLWCLFASSHPSNHRWISREEQKYLENSLKLQSKVTIIMSFIVESVSDR